MILYFSGTGNSLAIARSIAKAVDDQVLPLTEAVQRDLTSEKRIGLVYPSYDFNMPPAVRNLVSRLKISAEAYVFIVIPCGAQVGNSIWTCRRLLRAKGIEVAYAHKIRVPDNSAIAFGRNPNEQVWKFEHFAVRLEQIIADVKAEKHAFHFSGWSFAGWLMGLPSIERSMIRTFRPKVNEDKCIGCGICAKVCPMENIVVVDEKAHIGDQCTICLGCVHSCPQQAVEVGNRPTQKDYQYHHPQIKLKDLLRR